MKTYLVLFAIVFGNMGAFAQAFGWRELGIGNNALHANGFIFSLSTGAGGEVYAGIYNNSDTGSCYISKSYGITWDTIGTNGYPNFSGRNICTGGFGFNLYALCHPDPYKSTFVAKYSFGDWTLLPYPGTGVYYYGWMISICSDVLDNLYAGGYIFDTNFIHSVLKWETSLSKWRILPVNVPGLVPGGSILSLSSGSLGTVYISGNIGDSLGRQVYEWNDITEKWRKLGNGNDGLCANGYVLSLCTGSLGNVYAAGNFTNSSGKYYVAEWDGFSWGELGGINGLNVNGSISSICADVFGNIYAGGSFTNDSGYYYVAKWDGMSWNELGKGENALNANNTIGSVSTDVTGNVFAAGNFTDTAGFHYVAVCDKITQVKWVHRNSNTMERLNSIEFPKQNTGYFAGQAENPGYAAGEDGTLLRTTDGGTSWVPLNSGTSNSLYSVYLPSTNTGYASGTFGTIIKTTDGGTNWVALNSGTTTQLNSVYFTDTTTGYAAGDGGILLKTSNGGTNWTNLDAGTSISLNSVYFTDANNGFIAGDSGTIIKTTDGGTIWVPMPSGTINSLHSVKFLDSSKGFIVGDSGTILKTTDGGASWTVCYTGMPLCLNSIYLIDTDTGYVAGARGAILKTTNGGIKWIIQNSGTSQNLFSLCFTSPATGYAVGDSGTILGTSTGGTGAIESHSRRLNNLKIYPNPASNMITIESYSIPPEGHLSISNLNGQEIIRHLITTPKTQVDITILNPGVYFVRLTGERIVEVGKFIKQ